MTQYFISKSADLVESQNQSAAAIANTDRREPYPTAYNGCFYFIACALLLSGLAIMFLKRVKAGGTPRGH